MAPDNDPDPRDGSHADWITATAGSAILLPDRLAEFALGAAKGSTASLRVCRHNGVAAIEVRGERSERNAALLVLRGAFYAAGCAWVETTSDFAWLKSRYS